MSRKGIFIALVCIGSLWVAAIVAGKLVSPQAQAGGFMIQQTGTAVIPEGYDGFGVAIGNGVTMSFADIIAYENPVLFDECQDLLGRTTAAQRAQHRADAIQFFEDRFGIVDPDNNPDVIVQDFTVTTAFNYRVYAIGGVEVPASGWRLHDCGYQLTVTNPAGITLGGEFPGHHAPQNTAIVYGDYFVDRRDANGQPHPHPFKISFRSRRLGLFSEAGLVTFQCELYSPDFGPGLAQGMAWSVANDPFPGLYQTNTRNVWTFSAWPFNGL